MFASQQRRLRSRLAVVLGAVIGAAVLAPLPAAAASGADVIINEAYLKGGSANAVYTNKFVELYNAGDAAQSLDGWSLQYRSATSTAAASSANILALSGTIEAGDHYLIGLPGNGSNGAELPDADLSSTSLNPSGTTGTLILASTTTGLALAAGSSVGADGVVDLLGYGTSNTFETAAATVEGANSVPNSLVRTEFADTDDNSADFSNATEVTPQASSATSETEPTDPSSPETTDPSDGTVTAISEIQGTGETSPLAGQTVTTRGIVTAAYPSGGYNGFYIQTPGTGSDLDLDTHTSSDAIFVYGSSAVAKVQIGDYVEVTGPVSEYNGTTEISPTAANVTVLAEDAAAVTAAEVAWPTTDAQRETLEGMLVAPQGEFTVSDTYDTNYYGSIGLAAGTSPLLTPTDVAQPGTEQYDAVVADNAARQVTLDDGSSLNFNSAANKSIALPYLSTADPVRVGAAVTFTQPVIVEYRNSAWSFQPTQRLTVDNAATVQPATFENTRTAAPEDVGGDIQISSFNVLNYFTTTGEDAVAAGATCSYYDDRDGNHITVNTCSDPAVRGAADAESLARQQAKIVAAINALGAEVVSLEEIENSAIVDGQSRDAALATLVDALNAALGSDEWAYVPSPTTLPASEDVIRTAFIYKKAAVEPVGESVIDVDAAFENARYPLAQAFEPAGGSDDDAFIAIVNHFKSKGSGTGENADQGDGQGASNAARVGQATALVAFADQLTDDMGTDDVFLLGDFNSYTEEDPMQVLYEAGYIDLGSTYTDEHTYSYDGQSGSLDHILASADAAGLVTGADVWNINSGESIALEYSRYNYNVTSFYDESPYRSSDHDPVVVGVDFGADDASTVELNLLNINDFHGRIDSDTVKFAGTIEQLRAEYGEDNTLFLSDGDNIGASLFASAVADDQPTLDVLNALDLQTSAVGNHEFDKGLDDLLGRVSDEADFSYLGANVYAKGTTTPVLPEYATFEVDGLTVAVIGAVTEETASLVSPGGIADIDFGDPVEAVNRVASQLSDGDASNGEADVIIAEYHEGAVDGTPEGATLDEEVAAGGAFANIVTDTSAAVDVIFNGHTHKEYVWDAPVPGEDGKTRPVLQTGSYGENIGQIVLTVDSGTGEVVSYAAQNVARTTTEDASLTAAYPRVAEVAQIVDAALAEASEVGDTPVGSVTSDITTAYAGGSYVDGVWTGGSRDDRASQSTLGNLVADSLVSSLSDSSRGGAEIGIVNPGGLRAELLYGEDGVITYAEANAVLPFVNNLWTTTITGAQFKEVLEQQWQPDGSSRPYLALGLSSNVSYTYDASAERGSRITGIWVDGVPIEADADYRVGSFSFLLQGGDNFTVLAEGTDTRDSGLIDRDAWISYLQENPGISPDFSSRSAQVTGVPDSVGAGSTLTFQVSGLNLTSLGSPANTTLEASIGDTVYAPLTVTDGAATVELSVPTEAAGEIEVLLTAPDSGTQIHVPVTVTAAAAEPTEPGDSDGDSGSGTDTDGGSLAPTDGVESPAADADLTSDLEHGITVVSGEFVPGGVLTVHVGTQYSGQWVTAWLHSDPISLGWQQVDVTGDIRVTLPAGVTGTHRLVVQDASGNVIGWETITIGQLAATGGAYGDLSGTLALAVLLLAVGAGARTLTVGRRRS
ncbi:MAG: ExeM/NucH family extracellular endonuclease [Microbacterium sp.]|uniref:ExeM/NucH family extracellular endonuclease n=1 Tax=Microbacterium sp. TaxID=51671 RepID=UPI0039E3AAF9